MGQSTPLGLFISLDNWIQGKIQICQYVCSHFSCGDIGDTHRDTQMDPWTRQISFSSLFETIWSEGIPYWWHVLFPSCWWVRNLVFPRISMLEHSQWVGGSSVRVATDQQWSILVTRCRSSSSGRPTHPLPPWMCTVGHCGGQVGAQQQPASGHRHTWQQMHSPTVSFCDFLVWSSPKQNLVTNSRWDGENYCLWRTPQFINYTARKAAWLQSATRSMGIILCRWLQD